MSIKLKVILFTVLVTILSVSTLGVSMNYFIVSRLEESLSDKVQIDISLITEEIDSWFSGQGYHLETVAKVIEEVDNYDREYIENFLSYSIEKNPGNVYCIGFEDKTFIDGTGWVPEDSYDVTQREWYIKGLENKGKVMISEPYVDSMTGAMVATISYSFETKDGLDAVVSSDIYLDVLQSLFNSNSIDSLTSATVDAVSSASIDSKANSIVDSIKSSDFDGSYIFLIGGSGEIISHPNIDYMGTPERILNISSINNGAFNKLLNVELDLEDRLIKDYDGVERLFFFDTSSTTQWKVGVGVVRDSILGVKENAILLSVIVCVLILLLSSGIAVIMLNKFLTPLKNAVSIVEDVGNLDFTTDIDKKSLKDKSEVGAISKSLHNLVSNLQSFMKNVSESVKVNKDVNIQVSEKFINLMNNSEETSSATQQLSASMEETAASLLSISETTSELDNAITDFTEKIGHGALTSSEISNKARELNETFNIAKNDTMSILEEVKSEILSSIEAVKEVEKIEAFANTILNIASQTNLLSLNATIEAARAGDSGRGFAVVANEIRKLSSDSDTSAKEIQDTTQGIRLSVSRLVENANKLLTFVEKDVVKDYGLMLNAIDNYKIDGSILNDLLTDLSATSEQLAMSVDSVSLSISEISSAIEESTLSTTSIAEQNSNIVNLVSEIEVVLEKNMEVASILQEMLSKVKYN